MSEKKFERRIEQAAGLAEGAAMKLFTKNFTLLVLGQVFSLVGNFTLKFALSMYVLEKTGSAAVFGGLLSASMIPTVLLTPFGGVLADRANRRTIMVCLDLLSGLSVLAALLCFSDSSGIAVTGALLAALSVLGAFESPTVQACVPQMQSGENILRGNAVVNQVSALTGLAAPFLGGLFYAAFGVRPALAAAAACFFLTALLECFIRLPSVQAGKQQKISAILREDLLDSTRFLRRERREVLELLLFVALCSAFAVGTVVVGLPFLIRAELGLSAQLYGAAESAMGLAAVLAGLAAGILAGRLPFRRLNGLVSAMGGCVVLAGAAMMIPAEPLCRYGLLLAAFCGGQAAVTVFSIFALSAIQERTPEHMTGKVMAYTASITMCAQPVGQLMYGLFFDAAAGSAYLVLLPTGAVIWALGHCSKKLFENW
jgi:MFS family permease